MRFSTWNIRTAHWRWMLPILLLAVFLGAQGLNADVIWIDELSSVTHMGAFNPPYNLSQVVESIRQYSPDHVPLYFFLSALWGQIAGWSQFSLRLISCFFGVLMIAWLYRFAADAVNRRTAVAAAFLMSTTAFVVLYFHEMRMYTMLMMLAVMHSWLYWRLAHRFRITRLTWILFISTAGLLFYTHNFAAILFAGLGVYHLLFAAKSRRWLHIILAWGLGAVLFLPYIPFALEGFAHARNKSGVASTSDIAGAFVHLLVNGFHFLWLPLVLLFGYALWRRRNPAILRLLCLALIMVAALLVAHWQFQLMPISRIRYFLVLWFPFVILFAWSLTSVPRWFVITALFLLLWSVAGYQLDRSANIYDYAGDAGSGSMAIVRDYPPLHEYVYHLKDKVRSKDYLVGYTNAGKVDGRRKYGWSTTDYYLGTQLGIDGEFIKSGEESDLKKIRDAHPSLLFVYNPADKPPNLDAALDIIQGFSPCTVLVNKPDLLVQRYVNPVLNCDMRGEGAYVPIEYDNGIKVVDRFARYLPQEQTVQILTGWEVEDDSLLHEYNVSLQIITPDWQNMGRQTDRHLYEEDILKWYEAELSTDGLPPGDYRVMVIVYDRETNKKVHGIDLNSGASTDIFPILTFTIESE